MRKEIEELYRGKLCSPEEAARVVQSGDRVYIGTCSNIAYVLAEALADRSDELEDVVIASALTTRPLRVFSDPKFHHTTYFMGQQERVSYGLGTMDYHSVHLSQFSIWAQKVARPNVLFLEVTEPDEDGYVNMSTNGTTLNSYMIDDAETIVLQVNPNIPRVFGECAEFHISKADLIVEVNDSQHELPNIQIDAASEKISKYIVDQICDGATIQLGAGRLASAVGYGLVNKNNLGIHTELFSDSLYNLMKLGVVDNSQKTFYPGKSVIGFAWGSKEMYEFLDRNEDTCFLPMMKVNNPYNIAKNDNMISVNGAASIDITGQVSAETIKGRHYSGIGGQVDYVRGAQMSKGGKSFITLEATFGDIENGKGGSRIVSQLEPGMAVTTSRADVQYVVTEYGCVNLKDLSMKDRVKAMISIAHPNFRERLTDEAKRMQYL